MSLRKVQLMIWCIAKHHWHTAAALIIFATTLVPNMAAAKKPKPQPTPAIPAGILAKIPQGLRQYHIRRVSEGTRNWVLNSMELGLAAMRLHLYEESKRAFDEAITRIETIYANTESAAKARSNWYDEGAKDFKGEPYERAMAFFYRGLLYIRDGELDNARACFRSGLFQDELAEETQYRADFASLHYLEGMMDELLDSPAKAKEKYALAKMLVPRLEPPKLGTRSYLVVGETGKCPRKVADGPSHEQLKFRPGRNFQDQWADLVVSESKLSPSFGEDVYFQAATRGGRPIDKILNGKAHLRKVREGVGDVIGGVSDVAVGHALYTGNEGSIDAAAALGLVSGIFYLAANRLKPHADTRYWTNLPDQIFFWVLPAADDGHTLNVEYVDNQERVVAKSPLVTLEPCEESLCVVFFQTPDHNDMPVKRPLIVKRKEPKKKRKGKRGR